MNSSNDLTINVPVYKLNKNYLALNMFIGEAIVEGYEEKAEIALASNNSAIYVTFMGKKYMVEMTMIFSEILDIIVKELMDEGNGPVKSDDEPAGSDVDTTDEV